MNKPLRLIGLLVLTTAMAGCLGSGSGGGGGGTTGAGTGGTTAPAGNPFASYNAAYRDATAQVLANAPTSNMPVSGRAEYTGQVRIGRIDGNVGGKVADGMLGDLALDIGFANGSKSKVSGSIDNIQIKDGNKITKRAGTLTTDYAAGLDLPSTVAIVSNTVDVPTQGPRTLRTGSYNILMGAAVTKKAFPELETNGDIIVGVSGAFTGDAAKGGTGPASAQLFTGTVQAGGGVGTNYIKRK